MSFVKRLDRILGWGAGSRRQKAARLAALLLLGGLFFLFGWVWLLDRDLPSVDELKNYQPILSTKVYASDGALIGQFYVEKRVLVPLNRMPKALPEAVVAVEDSRFYRHSGIDLVGIFRAAVTDIVSLHFKQGASTITQQLARTLFLSPERTISRKIREILLARRIEALLDKDEILEIYLSQIYFGHGAYGVGAAARTYFGKDVSRLSLAECAFMAGLPKAPSDYSPYLHPDRVKTRQGVVLKRMVEEGVLSDAQYRAAYAEDLVFQKPDRQDDVYPYFLDYVRQRLMEAYGEEAVYKGGLSVKTTLDPRMQVAAVSALRKGLRDLDKRRGFRGPAGHRSDGQENGKTGRAGSFRLADIRPGDFLDAVVTAVGPRSITVAVGTLTGIIAQEDMAWARRRLAGPDFKKVVETAAVRPADLVSVGDVIKVSIKKWESEDRAQFALEQEPLMDGAMIAIDPATGAVRTMVGGYDFRRSEFNRAVLAKRQPGSAFKPIIYAAAVDKGWSPGTIIEDAPVVYDDPVLKKIWKPENYEGDFYGPIPLREALAHSRNLATIRLLEQVGVGSAIDMAQRLGIREPLARDLSLALGTSSVTLWEMTRAFGVFASGGNLADPLVITQVRDHEGRVLESHDPVVRSVLSPETTYLTTNMMEDVIRRGTGSRARVIERPLAGKTGTTNEYTDAWFIGFSPELVAGVWVGFDDRQSLGDREAASNVALPIWIDFMKTALEPMPPTNFPIPGGIVYARVDPKTGLLAPRDDKDAVVEVFAKGNEPTRFSDSRAKATHFFDIDQP